MHHCTLYTLYLMPTIDPQLVDQDAAKVVRRLHRYGHEAYLVGGCVRDLLLGRQPKDFDVATSATPTEIKQLFRNCRIIGRRFRLAHIIFRGKIIETSTFRSQPPPTDLGTSDASKIIRRDNIFGTAEEDALRRDFTVNGLFHDLRANRVIDYVGGLEDLRRKRIRTIGDPQVRIPEDPVRIIRAIKFAARLGFRIDRATESAMVEHRGLISLCSVARVLEEIYKLLGSGATEPAFKLMHRTGVLSVLFPELAMLLDPPTDPQARAPVQPIHNRSQASPPPRPRTAEEIPRDVDPEPLASPSEQPAEDLARYIESLQRLVDDLIGDQCQPIRQWTWSHLRALDRAVVAREAEDPPLSHAQLLAAVLMGPAAPQITEEQPFNEAIFKLEELVRMVTNRLRVSRKDRERLKQIMVAQRRMVHRGKRTRPTALMRREYFPEAWWLFEMTCQATGRHRDMMNRWHQLQCRMGPRSKPRRRRPRRRRGQSPPKK